MMRYRILDAEEWGKLAALVPPEHLPAPASATAAVAESDDGEIWGVLFLQLQLHMEPLLIRSPVVNFVKLAQTLHEAVAHQKGLVYFAFTDDDKVARMAELAGMEPLTYRVWKREVH